MRRVDSFGFKIFQFLVSKTVCIINACSIREFVKNYLIKCNQTSASHLAFTSSKLTMETLEQGVKIYSKLTIKTPERRQGHRSVVFIVNFEHVIAGWVICISF